MRMANKKASIIEVEFERKELEIISRALGVPLGAFGLELWLGETRLTKEKLRRLYDKLEFFLAKDNAILILANITNKEIKDLSLAFKVACKIIEEWQFHIMTGYSWQEAQAVSKELEDIVVSV